MDTKVSYENQGFRPMRISYDKCFRKPEPAATESVILTTDNPNVDSGLKAAISGDGVLAERITAGSLTKPAYEARLDAAKLNELRDDVWQYLSVDLGPNVLDWVKEHIVASSKTFQDTAIENILKNGEKINMSNDWTGGYTHIAGRGDDPNRLLCVYKPHCRPYIIVDSDNEMHVQTYGRDSAADIQKDIANLGWVRDRHCYVAHVRDVNYVPGEGLRINVEPVEGQQLTVDDLNTIGYHLSAIQDAWHDARVFEDELKHTKEETTMNENLTDDQKVTKLYEAIKNAGFQPTEALDILLYARNKKINVHAKSAGIALCGQEAGEDPVFNRMLMEVASYLYRNSRHSIYAIYTALGTSLRERKVPDIKKVICSNGVTTVLWDDGTKTQVRAQGDDKLAPDDEKGLAMAIAKKALNVRTPSEYYDVFKRHLHDVNVEYVVNDSNGNFVDADVVHCPGMTEKEALKFVHHKVYDENNEAHRNIHTRIVGDNECYDGEANPLETVAKFAEKVRDGLVNGLKRDGAVLADGATVKIDDNLRGLQATSTVIDECADTPKRPLNVTVEATNTSDGYCMFNFHMVGCTYEEACEKCKRIVLGGHPGYEILQVSVVPAED